MDLSIIDNGHSGKGLLFVISSVSGGGKTTIIKRILNELGDLRLSVSYTTRQPRDGEEDGKDYNFIPRDSFDKMVERVKTEELPWLYLHDSSQNVAKHFGAICTPHYFLFNQPGDFLD